MVGVTPLSGTPRLVVSTTHPKPGCKLVGTTTTCYNYTWSSTSSDDVVLVTIPRIAYNAGSVFYIGVYG